MTNYKQPGVRYIKTSVVKKKKRTVRLDRILLAIIMIAILILVYSSKIKKHNNENVVFVREAKSIEELEQENLGEYVWGIDISRWQVNSIDLEWMQYAVTKGCKFVYIQFGKTNIDDSTLENPILDYTEEALTFANMAESAGLDFGFYFLTDAKMEGPRLSELGSMMCFLNTVKEYKFTKNTLPLMLDHEVYGNTESLEDSEARCQMLVRQISDLNEFGIEPIIYTSASRYEYLNNLMPNQTYWLADYSLTESGEMPTEIPERLNLENVAMWQYSGDNLLIEERGIPVYDKAANGPIIQQGLDRNLMKTDFYLQLQ